MKHWFAQHILLPLVMRDFRLREQGKRPDKLYWAEVLLLRWRLYDYVLFSKIEVN